jgi:LPXTG-motif cell wall-anchored protein
MFYNHPILILLAVAGAVGAGIYIWRRKKSEEESRT